MKSLTNTITKYNLFNNMENIGVACSGGSDSICLLHFLQTHKTDLNINVYAINVNHKIRTESDNDSIFVENFCKQFNIPLFKTSIDCLKLKTESNQSSLENIARNARYNYFNFLLDSGKLDKICLGHHQSDQAETILLNIFRGSGLNGAGGMNVISGKFIRPLLETTKSDIMNYICENGLEFVTDESNFDTNYSRNFIRQTILPLIEQKFPTVQQNICQFGAICKTDNDYINQNLPIDNVVFSNNLVKIPIYLINENVSVSNRLIMESFRYLKSQVNIEQKHIELVHSVAQKIYNKAEFPNNIICVNENEYISFYKYNPCNNIYKFSLDEINFNDECNIKITDSNNIIRSGQLKFDMEKLPKNLVWRKRMSGDTFVKINGTRKKLKDFLIERKIPQRNRDCLPVLALENEIYIVADIEICDKIKITKDSKKICQIVLNKNYKE